MRKERIYIFFSIKSLVSLFVCPVIKSFIHPRGWGMIHKFVFESWANALSMPFFPEWNHVSLLIKCIKNYRKNKGRSGRFPWSTAWRAELTLVACVVIHFSSPLCIGHVFSLMHKPGSHNWVSKQTQRQWLCYSSFPFRLVTTFFLKKILLSVGVSMFYHILCHTFILRLIFDHCWNIEVAFGSSFQTHDFKFFDLFDKSRFS